MLIAYHFGKKLNKCWTSISTIPKSSQEELPYVLRLRIIGAVKLVSPDPLEGKSSSPDPRGTGAASACPACGFECA